MASASTIETGCSDPDVQAAVARFTLISARDRLGKTTAGRDALAALCQLMAGPNLDGAEQEAVFTLLRGAWGSFAGTTRDLLEAY